MAYGVHVDFLLSTCWQAILRHHPGLAASPLVRYTLKMAGTFGGDSADDPPDWFMPPRMIGGHVTGPALIEQTDGYLVAVRQVLAYPSGVEVEIEAHARGPSPGGPPPDPVGFGEHHDLRFRVRLADGRDVVQDDDTGLRSGPGPMLLVSKCETSSGGPDNREDIRLTVWLSPLPPPGPLTLTCSWPRRGLRAADFLLDPDAIQAAAGQARPFWPASS